MIDLQRIDCHNMSVKHLKFYSQTDNFTLIYSMLQRLQKLIHNHTLPEPLQGVTIAVFPAPDEGKFVGGLQCLPIVNVCLRQRTVHPL